VQNEKKKLIIYSMKKALFLCFGLVITNFLVAQQSVSINGPTSVEVGVPYNYTFQFNPQYPTNAAGVIADSYIITEWIVSTGTNGSNAGIPGYIGIPSNQSSYYNDGTYNNSNPKTIPIQWGNGSYLSDDVITVKVSGIYKKSSTGADIAYFNYQPQATKPVTVQRLVAPIISGPSTVLSCNQTDQTYAFTNSTNSNQSLWTATGGAIIVGSTGTSVTVKPPLSGVFSVDCTVKRSGANTNYGATGSKTVTRSLFTTSAVISGNETICTNGTYTVTGLEAGLSILSWSATNASVATLSGTSGTSTTLTKVAQGTVTLIATLLNSCNETKTITKNIIVGSPMPLIDNFTCVTESAPCFLNTTANNNYLIFSLSAPIGNYTPLTADWQWEKITGNFFFLENGQYNSATATGRQGNIYLTGANPTDNPLKFRCRVKNACGWGNWRDYQWNGGTTTPIIPPGPPAKYYMVAPNPTGGYAANISLLNSAIVPTTTSPIIVRLYSIYGQELSSTQMYNNSSGNIYIYSFPYNTMYLTITFDNHHESHTVVKY
jgi:hypothetical protein